MFHGEVVLVPEVPTMEAGDVAVVLPATPASPQWFLAESAIMADVRLREVKRRGRVPMQRRTVKFIVPMAVHDEIVDGIGEESEASESGEE